MQTTLQTSLEQNIQQVLKVVDRAYLLEVGSIKASGSASELLGSKEIRKAYKALIKVLHPDMNGGDRSQEEQLSEVVWAWDQIKSSRSFREKD